MGADEHQALMTVMVVDEMSEQVDVDRLGRLRPCLQLLAAGVGQRHKGRRRDASGGVRLLERSVAAGGWPVPCDVSGGASCEWPHRQTKSGEGPLRGNAVK